VTIDGKAAPGVLMTLTAGPRVQGEPVATSTSDIAGFYKLTAVPPGQYVVTAYAPAYLASSDGRLGAAITTVTVSGDESLNRIDLTLVRGGVVTGRVTDAHGQPLIAEQITLNRVDESGRTQPFRALNAPMVRTDDRGVYRAYGLPRGRYTVGVGADTSRIQAEPDFDRAYYLRTFHPDATDEARATIVEVTLGRETAGVDIKTGDPVRTHSVAGVIVQSETGKPAPNTRYGCALVSEDGRLLGVPGRVEMNDSKGEFRLGGLLPGRYFAYAVLNSQDPNFSLPVPFQVSDEDVEGIEVKLYRGSSIRGTIVPDSASAPGAMAVLSQISLWATPATIDFRVSRLGSDNRIGPEGSFTIVGIPPGKVRLGLGRTPTPVPGLAITRVERDGIEQPEEIEIGPGEELSNVRVFVAYGTAGVQGQIRVEGGELPKNARVVVTARRLSSTGGRHEVPAQADARGRFRIEGLTTGEYTLTAEVQQAPGRTATSPLVTASKTVNVVNGTETQVTIVFEATRKEKQ